MSNVGAWLYLFGFSIIGAFGVIVVRKVGDLVERAIETTLFTRSVIKEVGGIKNVNPWRGSRHLRVARSWCGWFMYPPSFLLQRETGQRIYWPGRDPLNEPQR